MQLPRLQPLLDAALRPLTRIPIPMAVQQTEAQAWTLKPVVTAHCQNAIASTLAKCQTHQTTGSISRIRFLSSSMHLYNLLHFQMHRSYMLLKANMLLVSKLELW